MVYEGVNYVVFFVAWTPDTYWQSKSKKYISLQISWKPYIILEVAACSSRELVSGFKLELLFIQLPGLSSLRTAFPDFSVKFGGEAS